MIPEEIAAIRERAESNARWKDRELWSIAQEDRVQLLAEVERLNEEAVAANSVLARYIVDKTAFSDALAIGAVSSIVDAIMRELTTDSDRRAKIAEARLDKVRAATLEEAPVYYTQDQASGYDSAMATITDILDGSDQ